MLFWDIAEETKREKERKKEEEMINKIQERRNQYIKNMQGFNGEF